MTVFTAIKILSIFILLSLFTFLFYTFTILKPSNNRNWEFGFEKLPHITTSSDTVTIENFRDFHYNPHGIVSSNYITREIPIESIERTWFLFEPFNATSAINFKGVAHTYFVFDIKGQNPVAVSVEARREKGEAFGLIPGMLNQFELMYVWASEEDLTQRRILIEHNDVRMFPLTISAEQSQALFLQMVKTTQSLETTPRFYNTFMSNCTNELAKNANEAKTGSVPYSIAWVFPGYAVGELYKLHYIPTDYPLEKEEEQYQIKSIVEQIYNDSDFSKTLREKLKYN